VSARSRSHEEDGVFFTRGRIVRWTILLTLGVVAIVICWHDPVYAGSSPAAVWQHAWSQVGLQAADGSAVIDPAPRAAPPPAPW
jgi:hypothetical protein